MRRSGRPRYLERAGGGRGSDYSPRGAPHPRAAEWIFPWGGSASGEQSSPRSSWGIPVTPSAASPGGLRFPVCPLGGCISGSETPPSPSDPLGARGAVRWGSAPSCFSFFTPVEPRAREASRGGRERGGMKWKGGPGRWHPGEGTGAGGDFPVLGEEEGLRRAGLGRSVGGGAQLGGGPAARWAGGSGRSRAGPRVAGGPEGPLG